MVTWDAKELARAMLEELHLVFADNVRGISLEVLDAASGFRSILEMVKNTAAWSVYRPYAFEPEPGPLGCD